MKYIFNLSVLLFVFQLATTQNYRCTKDDATYFYSNDNFFKAISIDSVVDAGDSLVYYNYPNITDNYIYSWCYGRLGPSWIGRYVTVKPDGENIFYNKYLEPISIHTLKDTGEHWTFYTFDNGDYMQASITEVQEMEFLGITDTVKKITLQAYNTLGDSILNPLNDKYLLLSKNYSLIRTISFKYFPNFGGGLITNETCSEYDLCGISNPEIGRQNLTRAGVYNYDVGDEIHNEEYLYSWGSDYSKHGYYKNFYLKKEYPPNLDYISYLVYYCGYTKEVLPYIGTEFEYYEDTVTRNYFIGPDTIIDILPDKLIINKSDPYHWEYQVTNCEYLAGTNKLKKTMVGGYYSVYPHDCIEFMESKDAVDEKYYIERLGFYDTWLWPYSNSGGTEPVYFNQGDEEWGNPYGFNCNGYYTSIDQESTSDNLVDIAPNPMKEWTILSIESQIESEYSFHLFSSMGIQVKEFNFVGSECRITRDDLLAGIYFYVLESPMGFKTSGKLILQ